MQLAYIRHGDPGHVDRLLSDVAERLEARGLRLAGAVQTNSDCPGQRHCDMDLRLLPGGPTIRISQSLGAGSSACRLDSDALERAVGWVAPRLEGAALLVVNKFGKREAEGGGFREVIAAALSAGIPVLAGVNGLNHDAFLRFSDGLATELAARPDAVERWLDEALAPV